MTPDDLAALAAGLSEAQRAYLTTRAEWRQPTPFHPERWMAFPPYNVLRCMMRDGLIDRSGQINERGLALRAHLQNGAGGER